jgi:hypothetical protein
MKLPSARGPVSAGLIDALNGNGSRLPPARPEGEDDLQLALFVCYELAYRGWDGVDDRWEWNPGLLTVRGALEEQFEAGLHDLAGPPTPADPATVPAQLAGIVAADDGPSLSGYLRSRATYEQFREFVALRSVYHLREADPHTWAIPRTAVASSSGCTRSCSSRPCGGSASTSATAGTWTRRARPPWPTTI